MNETTPDPGPDLKRRLSDLLLSNDLTPEVRKVLQDAASELEGRADAVTEARLKHLNSILLGIRNVNQLIVMENDPERLIQRACVCLTETLGYMNAWIAILGGKAGASLGFNDAPHVAAVASEGFDGGFEPMYAKLVKGSFPACIHQALESGETVVTSDPPSECPECPLSGRYEGRAGLVRRLECEGVCYGVLTASVPGVYAYDHEEQDLFREVAGDLAFALHKIALSLASRRDRSRYLEIFRRSRDGFVMVSPEGRIIDANKAYCRMLGYSLDELRALPDFYSITPGKWHRWESEEIWNKLLLGRGYTGLYEKEYIRRDGTIFPVELSSYAVRDADGEIDYLWGTARDITHRKMALEELEHLKDSYEAIFNASTDCIFIHDGQTGEIIDVNRSAEETFGYSLEEMQKLDVGDMTVNEPPYTRNEAYEHFQRAMEEGPQRFEWLAKSRNGRLIWFENSLLYTKLAGQDCMLVVGRDITDRKKALEELKHLKDSYEAIFNASTDCIFIHDAATGEIVDVNQATLDTFGYTREEIRKLDVGDLSLNQPPFTQKEASEYMKKAVSEGPQKFEWLARKRNGELIWFENTLKHTRLAGVNRVLVIGRDINEWKKAETALRASEKRFKGILESASSVAVQGYSLDGTVLYWNRASESFYGYSAEEALGANLLELIIPPGMREHVSGAISLMAETGEAIPAEELELMRKDGSLIPVYSSHVPVQVPGREMELFCIDIDLSERREAEEALRDSERRLQESQRTARIGHVEFNIETGGLLWSDMMYELYERDPALGVPSYEEVMGMHSPEDAALLEEAVWNAVRTGEGYAVDLKVLLPSEREAVYHAIGTPETDADGRVIRITGTVQDVTDRKLAELRLQDKTSELEQILDSLPDAVVYADSERRIRKVNPAFTRIFGYAPEEVAGKSTRILYRSDEEFLEQGRKRYNPKAEQSWEPYEIHHVRKDGSEFISESVGLPVLDSHGSALGLLGIVRDVSAQRLLQERMNQMEKMESVGRLAGGVAHDFNNMLNVILGHTDMVLDRLAPDHPHRESLEEVRKAGRHSADLTRQLLAFARRQTITPRVLDLNETIASMLKMLERLIGEDIELRWTPGEGIPPVMIDPGQVDQILANLAINARDAIGHRHGTVTIETFLEDLSGAESSEEQDAMPGAYVVLSVTDDGCGMDRDTLSHIFEPFYTTKENGKGTGLGLATIYGIVRQNGGFIRVKSEPGQGSVFMIHLPVHAERERAKPENSRCAASGGGNETILLVEDEPAILKLTALMLEQEGYTVLCADSPGAAVSLAGGHPGEIGLLITDVVMPEMNGRELAKKLLSLHPSMKRLFMSGYTADVIAHQGVLEQDVNFLQKPFSKVELAAKVREILDRDQV